MSNTHVDRLGCGERDVAGQERGLLHDGVVMAAMRVGVPATRGDRHTFKTQPTALQQAPSHAPPPPLGHPPPGPTGLPVLPEKRISPRELKPAAWTRHSTSRMGNRKAAHSSQTGSLRLQPLPFFLWLSSLVKLCTPHPRSSHDSSSTDGYFREPPSTSIYLQSASGWVPAMDSGMTVACCTEVWVATPVSCCQAGGSRIC